jgi:hypothetical protein
MLPVPRRYSRGGLLAGMIVGASGAILQSPTIR